MSEVAGSKLRPWQFSLRTLLLLPVIVALLAGVGSRIYHNRQQREAVHTLWRMGIDTYESVDAPVTNPMSEIAWAVRENWIDDLLGTYEPLAVRIDFGDSDKPRFSESDCEKVATLVRQVPSIQYVIIAGRDFDDKKIKILRTLLPDVKIDRFP